MGYQKEREEFIVRVTRAGMPLEVAQRLLSSGSATRRR